MNQIQLDLEEVVAQLGISKERLEQWKAELRQDSGTNLVNEEMKLTD